MGHWLHPDRWKDSHTILLYKNKGTILDLGYYRRIGLENTLYKLWTKVVQGVMATYAESTAYSAKNREALGHTETPSTSWKPTP
jgi:hypothetical protein